MSDNTGGGKSTLVQAPQRTSAPVQTGTKSGGFVRGAKKKVMTAGDFKFKNDSPPAVGSYAPAPKNPYPLLQRNDVCGCGSKKKYKKCCLL